ncbi:hypothetical protein GE061_020208 [Apolygus lucorum]|uniref:Uncharacterized protein n=1 Tax=Apolygus lucorum TaxID=248454 RepID=A0A6A4KNE6_APOLU|nr:hypothetical protein GE061_020208 [Apolygus lucorum]
MCYLESPRQRPNEPGDWDESQQIAAEQLLYRVQHPAQQESRLQTIQSLDIELPERKNTVTTTYRGKTNLSHDGLNPAHVPYWRVNNPTLGEFCFAMIGRADIEGSKSDVAMNAWPPRASYPCGNFSDTSC